MSEPSASAGWEGLVGSPSPRQHVAQLYTRPDFLFDAVGRYAGEGLRGGEAVLLVATALHVGAMMRRLEAQGLALGALVERGQLIVLDATDTLSAVVVDGRPDPGRFEAVIGGAVASATAAGYQTVRAFGDMVDLRRGTSEVAALRLEALWNELLAKHGLTLLCGYSLDAFDPTIYEGLVQRVATVHSHLMPVEDYARLDQAVERAYADVFGTGHDGGYLRGAFLAHYVRPAAMPDAQAAILAVRVFVPAAAADLLDRVRHHYWGFPAAAA
jgi:MEDS: MEthanogen/methylotroph, DcmR Sensory domain